MNRRVLLLQIDPKSSKVLADYFTRIGDKVWITSSVTQAGNFISKEKPDLIFVDLHLPGNDLSKILRFLRNDHPTVRVIITNRHPDYRREMIAKEQGALIFLRQPFTPTWIENAISNSGNDVSRQLKEVNKSGSLPRVRVPMRYKITFPYVLLALLFAVVSAFLVSRYVLESMLDRFTVQLIDTAKLSSDWLVQEESRLLETLRLVANTEGVADAVVSRDEMLLNTRVLPIAINSHEDAIEIIDLQGVSLLSLHQSADGNWEDISISQGGNSLANLDFVQNVLQGRTDGSGDKYAGLARMTWGDFLYIVGPIKNQSNELVGAVLVGKSLPRLVKEIRQDTLAHVTLYELNGLPLASTLFIPGDMQLVTTNTAQGVILNQDDKSNIREIKVASSKYSELLGPWEVRGGNDIGIIGSSLAQNYYGRPTLFTRFQLFLFVMVGLVAIIIMGVFLAYQITNPLSKVVQASIELAKGNLEVRVPSSGNDEVSVLAHAFNYMVSGLQEGIIYRDLLGRTVSPQVRETLRRSFASGDLRLEGQNTEATVLMSDIRGFTALAEKEDPPKILNWLNEYFSELVPVIASYGGVVDKFEGDAMLAFFGILPTPIPAQKSAYQACQAAIEMLKVIETINERRAGRGEPALITGIGINTGVLIAGGLGTSDRLNYTVIGDTVNTTQRIQGMSNHFGESGIVVSESTLVALGDHRADFHLEPLGEHTFKGKMELLWLYRLYPSEVIAGDNGNKP